MTWTLSVPSGGRSRSFHQLPYCPSSLPVWPIYTRNPAAVLQESPGRVQRPHWDVWADSTCWSPSEPEASNVSEEAGAVTLAPIPIWLPPRRGLQSSSLELPSGAQSNSRTGIDSTNDGCCCLIDFIFQSSFSFLAKLSRRYIPHIPPAPT